MKRILLVDDDPIIEQIYRKKLVEAGFQVDVALDGLGAMKLLHATAPEVVVLDLMMPKFNGLEVLKYIRSERGLANVRVIILSNMYFGVEQLQAATAEADKAFAKSACTPAILIAAINEVLAAPRDKSSPKASP